MFQLLCGFSGNRPRRMRRPSSPNDGLLHGAPSLSQVSDERPSDVLGALPHRRPQRRSDKRQSRKPVQPQSPTAPNGSAAAGTATAERGPAPRAPAPTRATAAPTRATAAPKRATAAPKGATAAPASLPSPHTATPRRRTKPLRQPAQPPGTPPSPEGRPADRPAGRHVLGTAAQAAAELAGIGLSISARALRNAVDRLPRP